MSRTDAPAAKKVRTPTTGQAATFGISTQGGTDRVVTTLATGRTAVAVVMLVWPSLLPTLVKIDRDTSTKMAWALRLVGSRELAIGLGSLIAGRAEPNSARRTWLAANMLTDATDSIAFTAAVASGTVARRPGAAMGALAAALATAEAVLLTQKAQRAS